MHVKVRGHLSCCPSRTIHLGGRGCARTHARVHSCACIFSGAHVFVCTWRHENTNTRCFPQSPLTFSFFIFYLLYFMCMDVLPAGVSVHHEHAEPMEARRGHGIP